MKSQIVFHIIDNKCNAVFDAVARTGLCEIGKSLLLTLLIYSPLVSAS